MMTFGHATNLLKHLGQFVVALKAVQLPGGEIKEEKKIYRK